MKIPLLYKDRREEGHTSVRKAQLIELHLLEVFRDICDRHKLRFWLVGGTLLGAMRHKGFIPWDDDLDVMILEEDYRKFLSFAVNELPDDVYLEIPSMAPRMENHITRLRDNYSWGLIRRSKRLLINDHHGVSIDIFPVRECGNKNWFTMKMLRKLSSWYGYYKRAQYNEVTIYNLLKKWGIGSVTLLTKFVFELTQLFCDKKYYVLASWFVNDRMWWPKSWLVREDQSFRTAIFDGIELPIPFEAESVLEMQYGDWRKLPAEDERTGYLSIMLPTMPCFHPSAMKYPSRGEHSNA